MRLGPLGPAAVGRVDTDRFTVLPFERFLRKCTLRTFRGGTAALLPLGVEVGRIRLRLIDLAELELAPLVAPLGLLIAI